MLTLIFAESSLELIPKEIQSHPLVISHAKKLGKNPSEMLLDNSWHYDAMKKLKNLNKRGRPDLVHFSLVEVCASPSYLQGRVQVYVHTLSNKIITLKNQVKLPKSFHRFSGVIEKLFLDKKIPHRGKTLLELNNGTLNDLISLIKPGSVIAFSRIGKKTNLEKIFEKYPKDVCIIIGGFQKGHFSIETKKKIDDFFSISKFPLESHTVTSRVLYEYEKTIFM